MGITHLFNQIIKFFVIFSVYMVSYPPSEEIVMPAPNTAR